IGKSSLHGCQEIPSIIRLILTEYQIAMINSLMILKMVHSPHSGSHEDHSRIKQIPTHMRWHIERDIQIIPRMAIRNICVIVPENYFAKTGKMTTKIGLITECWQKNRKNRLKSNLTRSHLWLC